MNPRRTSEAQGQNSQEVAFDIPLLAPSAEAPAPVRLDQAVGEAMRLLPPRGPLAVLVNDPQRHTDSAPVLRALARQADPRRISLLVACGTHSFAPEVKAGFAKRLLAAASAAAVTWHDCRGDLVPVGARPNWLGHPWLLDSAGVLAVGSVEPHYFAGFTGAHKTATVGVASRRDVEANHAHALDAACRPCRLAGNPVHEGIAAMLAALEQVRPVAAVNLVQAGPRILAAAGGRATESLHAAVPAAEAAFVRTIDRPADCLVLEVAGPLGDSFYQADKAIKNSEHAVRDGGCIVLEAACRDGIGQDHFASPLREAPTHAAAVETVRRRGYRLGDHKAVRLRHLTDPACRAVRVFVVSPGLSAADAVVLGFTKATTIFAALAAAGIDPARDHTFRVADAGNVCVRVVSGLDETP